MSQKSSKRKSKSRRTAIFQRFKSRRFVLMTLAVTIVALWLILFVTKAVGQYIDGRHFGDRVVAAAHIQGENVFSKKKFSSRSVNGTGLSSGFTYYSVERMELYRLSGNAESRLHDVFTNLCSINITDCSFLDEKALSAEIKDYISDKYVPDTYQGSRDYVSVSVPFRGMNDRQVRIYYFDEKSGFGSIRDRDSTIVKAAKKLIQKGKGPLYGIKVEFNSGGRGSDKFTTAAPVDTKGLPINTDNGFAFQLYAPATEQKFNAATAEGGGKITNEILYLVPEGDNPNKIYIEERSKFDSDKNERKIEVFKDPKCSYVPAGCSEETWATEPGKLYQLEKGDASSTNGGFVIRLDDTYVYIYIQPTKGTDAGKTAAAIANSLRPASSRELHFLTLAD